MKIDGKSASAMMLAALFVLTLVLVPAASARTTKCYQTIQFNDWGVSGPHPDHLGENMYWKGTITGDISGDSYYWETNRNYIVGHVEHFFEDFYIDFEDGWVSGYDYGTWNFATFNFRAHGQITDASEDYEYLIGCTFSEEGVTTNPSDGFPVTGICTCLFKP